MSARDKWRNIQAVLGTLQDGWPGANDDLAITKLRSSALMEAQQSKAHSVMASSFADPADVAAFRKCKAQGKSDSECFKVGDNGIGIWGDSTTGSTPICALPREDWAPFGDQARGKKVIVRFNTKEVACELRDTMPSKARITNDAGLDLNPAACAALGVTPPARIPVTWRWA